MQAEQAGDGRMLLLFTSMLAAVMWLFARMADAASSAVGRICPLRRPHPPGVDERSDAATTSTAGWLRGVMGNVARLLRQRRGPDEPVLEEVEGEPGGPYSLVEPPVHCIWPGRPMHHRSREVRPTLKPPPPQMMPVKIMSREAGVHTRVHFVNCTTGEVALYWLNYQGREVYYRSLLVGGEFFQPTYLSHPWVMRDKTTHMRLVRRDTNTTVVLPRVDEFTCHVDWPQMQVWPCRLSLHYDSRSTDFVVAAQGLLLAHAAAEKDLKQWDVIRASRSSITRCVEDICRVVIPGKYAFARLPPHVIDIIISKLATVMGPFATYEPVELPDDPVNIWGVNKKPYGYVILWP